MEIGDWIRVLVVEMVMKTTFIVKITAFSQLFPDIVMIWIILVFKDI